MFFMTFISNSFSLYKMNSKKLHLQFDLFLHILKTISKQRSLPASLNYSNSAFATQMLLLVRCACKSSFGKNAVENVQQGEWFFYIKTVLFVCVRESSWTWIMMWVCKCESVCCECCGLVAYTRGNHRYKKHSFSSRKECFHGDGVIPSGPKRVENSNSLSRSKPRG